MTQEQFIQVLPAYIGSQALLLNGMRGTIVCIDLSGDIIVAADKAHELHASNIKLILRSFDQMTDEEYDHLSNLEVTRFSEKCYFDDQAQKGAAKTNYLRSIGVDCDGLIEAGWAIKEGEQ